jgi:hypothetical protein
MKAKILAFLFIVFIITLSLSYRYYLISSRSNFTYEYSINKIESRDIQKIHQWISGINDNLFHLYDTSDHRLNRNTVYVYSKKFNNAEVDYDEENKTLVIKASMLDARQNQPLIVNIQYNPDKIEVIKTEEK